MTRNKNLKQVLSRVVKETLQETKGKKSEGTKLASRVVNITTVVVLPFSK